MNARDWVVLEGEAAAVIVLVKGRCEIVKTIAGAEQIVDVVEPSGFFGEVPLLLGSGLLAGIRARESSRLMRLEAPDFHDLVARCPNASHQILAAMARRVSRLQQASIATPLISTISHATICASVSASAFHAYRNHVELHIIPALGKVRLIDLRAKHLDHVKAQRASSPPERRKEKEGKLSTRTMHHMFCMLRVALNRAKRQRREQKLPPRNREILHYYTPSKKHADPVI